PDLSTLLTPTSSLLFVFFSRLPRPPISTLFPYTTLFRSVVGAGGGRRPGRPAPRGHPRAPARTPGPAAPTAVPDHEPALGRREGCQIRPQGEGRGPGGDRRRAGRAGPGGCGRPGPPGGGRGGGSAGGGRRGWDPGLG